MGDQNEDRMVLYALVIGAVLIMATLGGLAIYSSGGSGDVSDSSSYSLTEPAVDESFSSPSSFFRTTSIGSVNVSHTSNGLRCTVGEPGSGMKLEKNMAADAVALSLDLGGIVGHKGSTANVEVRFVLGGGDYCRVSVEPGQYSIGVEFSYRIGGTAGTEYLDMFYDNRGEFDLLVKIANGSAEVGIDGITDSILLPDAMAFYPSLDCIKVCAGALTGRSDIVIQNVQVGSDCAFAYRDVLHKTIVPDGKDFCISLHIHADRAYPQYFEEMAQVSEQYGLLGTYDAWYYGHPNQYGMDNDSYREALGELNDAGWNVGIHAGGATDLTREQVIAAIENITAEYGPVRTWSDHGFKQQDLCENGTVIGSVYYVKDLIEDIGAAWVHEWHSASKYYDLNIDGMNYSREGCGGLDLFRVSAGQALEFFQNPGREMDVGAWLRSWASERSVFVNHDYFAYFFYVTNATGSYSILPEHDGIGQTPWSDLNPTKVFTYDDWHLLPRFQAFLNWTTGYNVWFAPVRDVYDRSALVQQVKVEETDHYVKITNPTGTTIEGFTLYTKALPSYELNDGDTACSAMKGTGASWSFVIDLEPGVTVLTKKDIDDAAPFALGLGNSIGMPVMARADQN